MPCKIDLPKAVLANVFDVKIASLKRAINTASNELVKTALQSELDQLLVAKTTINEIK